MSLKTGNIYDYLEEESINSSTLAEFSQTILNKLKSILNFEKGEILIYNSETKELELIAETGLDFSYRPLRFGINESNNLASMVAMERRCIYIRDANNDLLKQFCELYSISLEEEIVSIPLNADGELLGVFQFFPKKERKSDTFSEIDLINISEWLGEWINRLRKLEILKNEAYKKLIEYIGDLIVLVDDRGLILDFNSAFEELLGYSRQELIKMNINEICSIIQKHSRKGLKVTLKKKNGIPVNCYKDVEVIKDKSGNISGYIKIFKLRENIESEDPRLISFELENKRNEALEKIRENLEYFEFFADKLINPLAIIKGYLKLKNEIEPEKIFSTIGKQVERIDLTLSKFRKKEEETFKLWEKLKD